MKELSIEDERIRKEIIDFFLKQFDYASEEGTKERLKSWIAWLEKQGEKDKFIEKQDDTKLRKYIEVASNVLVKLLESDKFQKDAREHLFDKGQDVSGIYDIYAKETIKYVKALFKQIENEY
jgi:hypothetical protein